MTEAPEAPDEGNGPFRASGTFAKFAYGLVSETGPLRDHNEDCAGAYVSTAPDDAWDRGPVFVLADGMGGHAAGEVASRLAVDTVIDRWTGGEPLRAAARPAHRSPAPRTRRSWTPRASRASAAWARRCSRSRSRAGKRTSRTSATRGRTSCATARASSSPTTIRASAEMMRMKMITPEQAATHPARSQLTQSLGADPLVRVDLVRQSLHAGDVFLLCCDGLWDVVTRAGDRRGRRRARHDLAARERARGTPGGYRYQTGDLLIT